MVLKNVLDFLIPVLWLLLALATLLYFWRVGRRHGLPQALRRLLSWRILVPFAGLGTITVLSAALVFIDPREIGVVVSLISPKGIREEPLRSGLNWIVPLAEQVVRYPIITQSYTMALRPREGNELGDDAIRARTADGQVVIIDITALFRIDPDQVVDLHIRWQDRYIRDFIRPGLRAFVRSQAAKFNVVEINSEKRQAFEAALNSMHHDYSRRSGIIPEKILVRNITFSPEYALSVEQKQTALQRVIEADYKARQIANLAAGEGERIRITARADADATVIRAQAHATARVVQARAEAEALDLIGVALADRDNLLTFRYIEKLAPNIKAMLLPSNAPLILPMPRLDDTDSVDPVQPAAAESSPLLPGPITLPPPAPEPRLVSGGVVDASTR